MENNNSKRWIGLDYKVASDYTHGSPEDYRTRLRQMLGLPILLPGEKNDPSTEQHIKTNPSEVFIRRNMSGVLRKGKRRND